MKVWLVCFGFLLSPAMSFGDDSSNTVSDDSDNWLAQVDAHSEVDRQIPITIFPPHHRARRIPIAIPDAMNLGSGDSAGLSASIARTLRRDLELSGYFDVLLPANFFFGQHADGMTAATVNFENWAMVGAQGLAKTAFTEAAGQVQLDFRLFDIERTIELELSFDPGTVGPNGVDALVHEFANLILLEYTGFRGPFGSSIAFVGRGRDGSREIYRMAVGDDGVRAVTSNDSINILPQWVGNSVAYTTYQRGNPDLAVGGGTEQRFLSSRPGLNTGGALSPDGTSMVVTLTQDGQAEIYLISPSDGSIIRRLTDNRAEDITPSWSPDGAQITFVSDRSGGPQIYVMNRDGSDQRRLTFHGTYNTTPDWSPDGTRIAFTGRDSHNRLDVFTVDIASSYLQRLTQDQGDNEGPSWSASGRYIVFSSTREGGDPRLYMMTEDGHAQTLLTREGSGYTMPAWQR